VLLHDLLRRFDSSIPLNQIKNIEITGIAEDSRQVRPGDLFIARIGAKSDGARFVGDAQSRGAAAVVTTRFIEGCALQQVVCDRPDATSVLANVFYGSPSHQVRVVGVTGTNGKTTTTYLIRHILGKVGIKCGVIGTVEIDDGKTRREADMTTPGAVDVARHLAAMRDNGCKACAIETSSHALDQDRVSGLRYAAGAFTNLTGDHLDYHKNFESYIRAKSRLFEMLPGDAFACVNAADECSDVMLSSTRATPVRWGFKSDCDYRAQDAAVTPTGTHFILVTPDGRTEVNMKLIGRHNIENVLCAASVVGEAFGLTVHQIASALSDTTGAPGRLQPVRAGQDFAVLVDYAHTDDALENVLTALRPLTRGKLRVVFGCGGDRDRTKRPRMAGVAQRIADVIYVTSDNPRTENPQSIIDEILKGMSADSPKAVCVEPDRRRAIERALQDAEANDVVLLAGKGHENYQIIGTTKHHFDDVEEAEKVLRARVSA
jgi:UDP-N-acetylmuramoyl-L-alanyl-D-glutamate--2,6-diaminopimelate ligase